MEPMDGGDSCLEFHEKESTRKLSKGLVLLQLFNLIATCVKGSLRGRCGSVAGLQCIYIWGILANWGFVLYLGV